MREERLDNRYYLIVLSLIGLIVSFVFLLSRLEATIDHTEAESPEREDVFAGLDEKYGFVDDCFFVDQFLSPLTDSVRMTCSRDKISGYPTQNVVALDEISLDGAQHKYVVRIFELVDADWKSIDSSDDLVEVYRESIPADETSYPFDTVVALDDDFYEGKVTVRIFRAEVPSWTGFPMRDSDGYSIRWKL